MSKLRLSIFVTLMGIAAFSAFADPFSFRSNAAQNNPASAAASKPTPPLSTDDFKAQVNIKSKQAQQDLFTQTQTNLKQQTSQMPLPNSLPQPPQLNQLQQQSPAAAPSSSQNQDQSSAATSDSQDNLPSTNLAPASAQPAPSAPAKTVTAAPNNTGSAASPSQNEVYTGFGTGTAKQPTSAPSSQSSGGWNVKY